MLSFDSHNSALSKCANLLAARPVAAVPAHVVEISCTATPQGGFTIITLQSSENIVVLMPDAPEPELTYR